MARVDILGDGLVGLAAALRLARLGHDVAVVGRPSWHATGFGPDPTGPDDAAATDSLGASLELPSAWRDLFAKTGRAMEAELHRAGLDLAPEPPTVHLSAGTGLELPTERGSQLRAVERHFDPATARRWAEVLDAADRVWQARRRAGLEVPVTSRPGPLPHLNPALTRTLPPPLAALATDPTRLAVHRVFGRWSLVGPEGPTDLHPLLDLLDARADRLGVEVRTTGREHPDAVVDTRAPRRRRPWVGAMTAPRVLHRRERLEVDRSGVAGRSGDIGRSGVAGKSGQWGVQPGADPRANPTMTHLVDHHPQGTVETWQWSRGPWRHTLTHDHTDPSPAPELGAAPRWWRDRAPVRWTEHRGVPTLAASAASHGGPEPWAQILTGALATYLAHERLTGEDVRPTNRAIGAAGRPRRRPGSSSRRRV